MKADLCAGRTQSYHFDNDEKFPWINLSSSKEENQNGDAINGWNFWKNVFPNDRQWKETAFEKSL